MAEFIIDATDAQLGDAFDARAFFGPRLLEEVVRCRDCRYYTPESMTREEHMFGVYENVLEPGGCFNPSRCSSTWDCVNNRYAIVGIDTPPDGFCAWGERSESK